MGRLIILLLLGFCYSSLNGQTVNIVNSSSETFEIKVYRDGKLTNHHVMSPGDQLTCKPFINVLSIDYKQLTSKCSSCVNERFVPMVDGWAKKSFFHKDYSCFCQKVVLSLCTYLCRP